MEKQLPEKRESDGKLNLKKVLRVLNKDNNFIYRDQASNFVIKVHHKYFPLQTLEEDNLLKIFWKLVSEHHFKTIAQENHHKLAYIKKTLNFNFKRWPHLFQKSAGKQLFWRDFNVIFSDQYAQSVENQPTSQSANWIKRLFVTWSGLGAEMKSKMVRRHKLIKKSIKQKNSNKIMKNKKILKNNSKKFKHGEQRQMSELLNEQQQTLNNLIAKISKFQPQKQKHQPSKNETIDDEIQELERRLAQNEFQNQGRLSNLEENIQKQHQQYSSSILHNQYDLQCFQWLICHLEDKQIAESVRKIEKCEKINAEHQFLCTFESAMNISPKSYEEKSLARINSMRQFSLLKFYKTGVKSLYSYICNNKLGLVDMYQHRMNLSKFKDKNYLQSSKKTANLNLNFQLSSEIDSFDVCHHCKFMFPSYLLTKCKFKSQRHSVPKIVEPEYESCLPTCQSDDKQDNNIRISQRFLAKQNNFNCYARVDEEYVCGRVYCKSCIKDNYGKDWFKLNNHHCPFCLGVCSCSRCLRNQKLTKLKLYYNEIGGNLIKLQQKSQFDQLFQRSCEAKLKLKRMPPKTKMIHKQTSTIMSSKLKSRFYPSKYSGGKLKRIQSKLLDDQQTSKSNNSQLLYPRRYKARRSSYKCL